MSFLDSSLCLFLARRGSLGPGCPAAETCRGAGALCLATSPVSCLAAHHDIAGSCEAGGSDCTAFAADVRDTDGKAAGAACSAAVVADEAARSAAADGRGGAWAAAAV